MTRRTRLNVTLGCLLAGLVGAIAYASAPPDPGGNSQVVAKEQLSTLQEAVVTASNELVMESVAVAITFSDGASPPVTLVIPIDSTAFDSGGTMARLTGVHGSDDVDLTYEMLIMASSQGDGGPCPGRDEVMSINRTATVNGGSYRDKPIFERGHAAAPGSTKPRARAGDLNKTVFSPATSAKRQI